jgi:hypothetical protein
VILICISNINEIALALTNINNLITFVKSTNAITAGSVIKATKKQAEELTNTTVKTSLLTITSWTEVQEEANHLNIINQSVISAKEGTAEAITKLVGSNITGAILWMANRSNHKSINDFKLFDILQVAINGADCLSTNNVLEQLIEVIDHTFDFCKKVSINMELMESNMA